MESKQSLSYKEELSLGKHHRYLGEIYEVLARCCAYVTLEAVECYRNDQYVNWDVDYFGALAAIELEDTKKAREYLQKLDNEKPVLGKLRSILRSMIDASSQNSSTFSWKNSSPGNLWDSLEVLSRMSELGNSEGVFNIASPSSTVVDGVECTPLLKRAQLSAMLIKNDLGMIRKELRSYLQDGFPIWSVSSNRGQANFGDPLLLKLAATAHLRLAKENLSNVMNNSDNKKLVREAEFHWIHSCFLLGQDQEAGTRLSKASDEAYLTPYRGWVVWAGGDQSTARNIWDDGIKEQGVKSTTDLLQVLSRLPGQIDYADKLRHDLIEGLGGLKDQAKLRRTGVGLKKLNLIYKHLGSWYFQRGILDSASHYLAKSHVINSQVSLDNYPATYVVTYFATRVLDGAPDFRQEGLGGFTDLRYYFPAIQVILEPLSTAMYCYDFIKLEQRANEPQ